VEDLEKVIALCEHLAAAWASGKRPAIESLVDQVPAPSRPRLVRELILTEADLRREAGQLPCLEDYRDRFPEHAAWLAETLPARATAPSPEAARGLLFGLLAFQNNFIDREGLLAALDEWVADKSRPLGEILVRRGLIDEPLRALLDALADRHLQRHDDDPTKSLGDLSSLGTIRDDLDAIADPDLQASLSGAGQRDPEATLPHPGSGSSTDRKTGRRFRIIRERARGGLGVIYEATDEELGRKVALKEIRPDKAASQALRSRFVVEAEITGGLQHPSIVPVYGLGTYDDGKPFYAMRFVEGSSLRDTVSRHHRAHPRPDPTTVAFRELLGRFLDVCNAIAFAHSKGVLHRDLKPHNIMIGEYGEALIIDWGLAKATGKQEPVGGVGQAAALVPLSGSGVEGTRTGSVFGTPHYMAPEQACGQVDRIGVATDVYGLGAILYNMLTAHVPVAGDDIDEILDRVRRGDVTPPREINPSVPRALEAICLKALANRPEDRYPGARALADDLSRWLADEPVSARREPLIDRARRWARKHRTLTATTTVGLLTALLGLALVLAVRERSRQQLDENNQRLARANEQIDDWADRAMNTVEESYTGVFGEALLTGKLGKIQVKLGDKPIEVEDSDLPSLADALLARPRKFYLELNRSATASLGDNPKARVRLANGWLAVARVENKVGRTDLALEDSGRSVDLFRQLAREAPSNPEYRGGLLFARSEWGLNLLRSNYLDAASRELRAVIDGWDELPRQSRDNTTYRAGLAEAMMNLGNAQRNIGRTNEAAQLFRQAIDLFEAVIREQDDPSAVQFLLAGTCYSLAGDFHRSEQLDLAVPQYARAIELSGALARRFPETSDYRRWLANASTDLASLHRDRGDLMASARDYSRAFPVIHDLLAAAPNHVELRKLLARAELGLGSTLLELHEIPLATRQLARSVEAWERLLREGNRTGEVLMGVCVSLTQMAQAHLESSPPDLVQAEAEGKRALGLSERLASAGPGVPELEGIRNDARDILARVLLAQGQAGEAADLVLLAVEQQRQAIAADPAKLATYRRYFAQHLATRSRALLATGEHADALATAHERRALWDRDRPPDAEMARQCVEFARDLARVAASAPDEETRRKIAAESVEALREAIRMGWSDPPALARDPAFAPIGDREDFCALIGSLWDTLDRAFPAHPFDTASP
jgi:serine/threonine-protein kinase